MNVILSAAFDVKAETQIIESDLTTEQANKAMALNPLAGIMCEDLVIFYINGKKKQYKHHNHITAGTLFPPETKFQFDAVTVLLLFVKMSVKSLFSPGHHHARLTLFAVASHFSNQ